MIIIGADIIDIVYSLRADNAMPTAEEHDQSSAVLKASTHILESVGPVAEHHNLLALPAKCVGVAAHTTPHLADKSNFV